MSNTRRFVPALMLIALVFVSAAFVSSQAGQNQFLSFVAVFVLGFSLLLLFLGAGFRRVERKTFVARRDIFNNIETFEQGFYLYIPYFHTVEAMMPNYMLRHEFSVDSIDTKTLRLRQIKNIRVRVVYRLVARNFCNWLYPALFFQDRQKKQVYGAASTDEGNQIESSPYALIKRHMKELDETEKLKPDNPELWIQILSKTMECILDDMIREWIWKWQGHVEFDAQLQLVTPFPIPLKIEDDPYAINLNRKTLADQIRVDVDQRTQKWGLRVLDIVFENITIDNDIVMFRTRSMGFEMKNAEHEAKKEAMAIRERGLAEAEVRAEAVAQIIKKLVEEKSISISDEMLYNIVRAAMYSDGEMIWSGVVEKGSQGGGRTK